MQRTFAVPVSVVLLMTAMNCGGPPRGNPEPSADLQDVVNNVVEQWMLLRASSDLVVRLEANETGWRDARTPEQFVEALMFIDDFTMKVGDIRASDKYTESPPSEEVFTALLIVAVDRFLQVQRE